MNVSKGRSFQSVAKLQQEGSYVSRDLGSPENAECALELAKAN
jgi:hypothetical protein